MDAAGSADANFSQPLQRSFVDLFAFVDVDGAADIAIEARIEQAVRTRLAATDRA